MKIKLIIFILLIFMAGCDTLNQVPSSQPSQDSEDKGPIVIAYNFDYPETNVSFFCINASQRAVEIKTEILKSETLLTENVNNYTQKTYLKMINPGLDFFPNWLEKNHTLIQNTCKFNEIKIPIKRTQIISGNYARQDNYTCSYLLSNKEVRNANLINEIYKECFKIEGVQ